MNETIPDKKVYQSKHCRMCWAARGIMIALAAATIYYFAGLSEADRLLMAECLTGTSIGIVDFA